MELVGSELHKMQMLKK